MRIDPTRGSFEDIIAASSPEIAAVAARLRERIAEILPEAVEVPRPAENHSDYALESEKHNRVFAYICPLKDYVRLGFYYGGLLPDPARILVGEGKRLRHIKIYSSAETEGPEIGDLLQAAVEERRSALGGETDR